MPKSLLSRVKMAEQTFMVVLAVAVGGLGGLGAVVFRALIALVQHVAWGPEEFSSDLVRAHSGMWIVLAPAIGGLAIGPLIYYFAREAKGHGVPEVMEAVALRSGTIRPRLVFIKCLASAITIGSGGSVGREGPIVQIGSALGSTIGQWLSLSGRRLKTLVGCGAAAGIAATFNAPIAGALFAVEVILGDFGVVQFSPIVISSVVATVVSRYFLGDTPAFVVPQYQMVSAWELLTYLVLGVVAGLVALAFVAFLYGLEDAFEALPLRPAWLITPVGGALVGVIGLFYPQAFGVGYESIEQALHGELALTLLATLLLCKLVATCVTLGAGGSGGVFAPSLFLGAMTGGLLGTLAHQWFPGVTAGPGAYALVGMGAVVAATTHAPITAILIIFELTSDYKLIVPLMTSCIIATLLATRMRRESIYTMKLIRRGVDLVSGQDLNVLKALRVADVMTREVPKVRSEEPFGELITELTARPQPYVYVVDGDDRLRGVIGPEEIHQALVETDVSSFLLATDLAREDVPSLTPEQDLDTVMRIFRGRNREELPVVAGDDSDLLIGVLSRRHLVDTYNSELMKRDMVTGLSGSLTATATTEVQLGDGYRMAELDAPGAFLGRTLRELDVRARFGVQVLLIHRPKPATAGASVDILTEPDTQVRRGDRLVVLAREDDLARLRSL